MSGVPGPIRESWGMWREREWLHRFGLDEAADAARRVASGPPLDAPTTEDGLPCQCSWCTLLHEGGA